MDDPPSRRGEPKTIAPSGTSRLGRGHTDLATFREVFVGSAFLHSSLVVWCAVSSGVALAQSARSAETDDPFVIGERQEIFSEILDETRQLIVGVPGDYDSNQEAYPVLYLLDGNSHFHHTTATADYLARNGRIPRTIVVAIPNTDRTRDLTPSAHSPEAAESFPTHGGADTFLRFISDELMPWMGEHYRTRSHATLIGHSFGGLFALHALVSRPDVFDAYVAISPSLQWDEQRLVKQADTMFARTPELTADLYMTVGNEGGTLLGGVRKFSGVLDEHAPRGFRWAFQLMEEETHGSVPLRSTQQGLEAVLAGWYLHDILSMFDRGRAHRYRRVLPPRR